MKYKILYRDRSGHISKIADEYDTPQKANQRIASIVTAQRGLGAYHSTPSHECFGIGRASFKDGSYVEAWRETIEPSEIRLCPACKMPLNGQYCPSCRLTA